MSLSLSSLCKATYQLNTYQSLLKKKIHLKVIKQNIVITYFTLPRKALPVLIITHGNDGIL